MSDDKPTKLLKALDKIAYQTLRELEWVDIARKALAEYESERVPTATNPSDSECAGEREKNDLVKITNL